MTWSVLSSFPIVIYLSDLVLLSGCAQRFQRRVGNYHHQYIPLRSTTPHFVREAQTMNLPTNHVRGHVASHESSGAAEGLSVVKKQGRRWLGIALASLLISACHEVHPDRKAAPAGIQSDAHANIEIMLNQSIDTLLDRHPSTFSIDCLDPVNVCWYKVRNRFSSPDLPSVTVMGDAGSLLELDNVGSITIAIDELLGREIRDIDFSIRGLPDDSPHSENKDFVYILLQDLIHSGWSHMYHFPAARIPGSQADKIPDSQYILGEYSLAHPWFDPRYESSLENWIKSDRTLHWYLHQDANYLHIKVRRNNSSTEPNGRGTYLISLELMSESSYWRKHFGQKQKDSWQQLLPELLEQYRQDRAAMEAKARAAGIEIEEDYRDPPIRALSAGSGQHL